MSLREVDPGLIEAAQAIGCNRTQIIQHVLLPEALPGIIAGFTVTLVTMINSSAIAGAIVAGGLGDIAYQVALNGIHLTLIQRDGRFKLRKNCL